MRSVIVIPARWASTRFPGKPLAQIAGVSLIRRVYERARRSTRADAVYVATDDDRILGHVVKVVLERFVALDPSPLELAESLEQLRALQQGFRIAVLQTSKPHLGVDRPEDVARVESELAKLHA